MTINVDSDRLYTRAEAALILGICPLTLRRGELESPRLQPLALRGRAYYTPALLAEWQRMGEEAGS